MLLASQDILLSYSLIFRSAKPHSVHRLFFFISLLFFCFRCPAQLPDCSGGVIYADLRPSTPTFTTIVAQSLITPTANPVTVLNNLPGGAYGLAIGPAFSFPAPNPTFWTTINGTYWYYNGSAWVNTTHSAVGLGAVNLAGGGSVIYNLDSRTNEVYVYNGTGAAVPVMTLTAFGGPYDLVSDLNDNVYALRTTTMFAQTQRLAIYNPSGSLLCSYSLAAITPTQSGGGFAICNNIVYVADQNYLAGAIIPGSGVITFTPIGFPNVIGGSGDWANCPLPVPTGTILSPQGSAISCGVSTLQLIAQVVPGGIGMNPGQASSSLTSCNYTWSGPGIVSGQSTATIIVNQAGVYTFSVCSSGCPVQKVVASFTITGSGTVIYPQITAGGCLTPSTTLMVAPNSNTYNYSWSGPGIAGSSTTPTIAVNAGGIYSVTVSNATGCSGSAAFNLLPPPVVTVAVSSTTLCAQNLNNSPASVTLIPSGAITYTLLTGSNYSATTGPPWTAFSTGMLSGGISPASATVIGSNGACTDTVVLSFSILPNATVMVTPAASTICTGTSIVLTASGAASYTWVAVPGLSAYSGSTVAANPAISTVYSVYGSNQGCNSSTQTASITVQPLPVLAITPAASPSICAGTSVTLVATANTSTLTWYTPFSSLQSRSLAVSPTASTNYTAVAILNGCSSSATVSVNVATPPVLGLGLSSNTLCAQGLNGSSNTLTLTPSGAGVYTLLTGPGYSCSAPSGSIMPVVTTGIPLSALSIATATLFGANGPCTESITASFSIIPNPVIMAAPAVTSLCIGSIQALTASGAEGYTWNGAGLSSYSGSLVAANPATSTVYSVTGQSAGCNSATQTITLNIIAPPVFSIAASSPTLCQGNSVTLTALGNANSYSWQPAGSLSSATGFVVTAHPPTTRTYSVTGYNGCINSTTVTLSVVPNPVVALEASANAICKGASVHLYARGAKTYSWAPLAGAPAVNGNNIIITPLVPTTFSVWGSDGACASTATLLVQTLAYPSLSVSAAANQICAGASLTLAAAGAGQFLWSPEGSLSAVTGSTIVATPLTSTNYTVTGRNVSGTLSCSQQVSYSVMVVPYAQALVSANIGICKGERAELKAMGGATYSWAPSTGLNTTHGANVIAAPAASTIYTVEVSYNGYCSATNTVMVAVHANPTVTAGSDTTFNLDEPMSLNAIGNGTLTWLSGEGIACSYCPNTRITPHISNCYIIEAVNAEGCKAQDQVCIILTDEYSAYIPNSFTPNDDGLNDVFFIYGTGLSEVSMDIYNRWGEHLFGSKDQARGWNGTYQGIVCKPDSYVYHIHYKGLNGKWVYKTGQVTICR